MNDEQSNGEELSIVPEDREPLAVSIRASRSVAVDRVSKGTALSLFGLLVSFIPSFADLASGPAALMTVGAAAALIGGGAIWAGMGATHLIRFGTSWSSLTLLSLVGLGGSILVRVTTTLLLAAGSSPILSALHVGSLASSALFMVVLLTVTVVSLLRWMLPEREADAEDPAEALPSPSSR